MKPDRPGSHPSDMQALNELQGLVYQLGLLGEYSQRDLEGVPDPSDYGIYPARLDDWLGDLIEYMNGRASTLRGVAKALDDTLKYERDAAKGDT